MEALEEEMERDLEDETVQDAERVRTQTQGSPARENVKNMRQHMRSTEAGALHVWEDVEFR